MAGCAKDTIASFTTRISFFWILLVQGVEVGIGVAVG